MDKKVELYKLGKVLYYNHLKSEKETVKSLGHILTTLWADPWQLEIVQVSWGLKECYRSQEFFDLYKLLILDQELLLEETLPVPRSFDLYKLLILDQELLLVVKTVLEGTAHLRQYIWMIANGKVAQLKMGGL